MFRYIEVRHYKCLRKINVELRPFNILIGPNASGKSTLLDVFQFLQDALESNVEDAVRKRANTLHELVWRQQDVEEGFEFALEVDIPQHLQPNGYQRVRYEVGIGLAPSGEIVVTGENLWFISKVPEKPLKPIQRQLFPAEQDDSQRILPPGRTRTPKGYRLVVRKVAPSGNDYFRSEVTGWNITFRLSPKRLALSGLPEDAERFPVALWFREMLRTGVQTLRLNSLAMRRPCPADAPRTFQADGSNLPIIISNLKRGSPIRFEWWVGHLQTVLEDVETVEIRERPEDRSQYLVIRYKNGLSVPSWMLSDGTLRLLALTLLAYLPPKEQVFLIEEPENGIHPRAIEAVFQALSSVYQGQIFGHTFTFVYGFGETSGPAYLWQNICGGHGYRAWPRPSGIVIVAYGATVGPLVCFRSFGVMNAFELDLIVLAPDADIYWTVHTLLRQRSASLGIRSNLRFEILRHPRRDPGVYREAPEFLRSYLQKAQYVVILDREGSGKETLSAQDIEQDLERRLQQNGWPQGRVAAVVLDPELEIWVWASMEHVARVIGLTLNELNQILQDLPLNSFGKPVRPKEALQAALRRSQRPRSARIFQELAASVGLRSCRDRAFRKFRGVLQRWFPRDV